MTGPGAAAGMSIYAAAMQPSADSVAEELQAYYTNCGYNVTRVWGVVLQSLHNQELILYVVAEPVPASVDVQEQQQAGAGRAGAGR